MQIKGIKFRIGKSHNSISIRKDKKEDENDIRLYMWSKYYTHEGKQGTETFSENDFKIWLGEKNTSLLFPFQLEFEEDVDLWFFLYIILLLYLNHDLFDRKLGLLIFHYFHHFQNSKNQFRHQIL